MIAPCAPNQQTKLVEDQDPDDAIFVNTVIDNDIPNVLRQQMVQDATDQDAKLARLKIVSYEKDIFQIRLLGAE